jgi:hypothetical protein
VGFLLIVGDEEGKEVGKKLGKLVDILVGNGVGAVES